MSDTPGGTDVCADVDVKIVLHDDGIKQDLANEAIVIAILLGVMVLNLLTLWNNETILKHGLAGILPVIGWVLAVLQAALAVQMIIHALRVLEVLHWPASQAGGAA
jgi:hypothetical protein